MGEKRKEILLFRGIERQNGKGGKEGISVEKMNSNTEEEGGRVPLGVEET